MAHKKRVRRKEPKMDFLTTLPIELQLMVIDDLPLLDQHHLRLTCQHFQRLIRPASLSKLRQAAYYHKCARITFGAYHLCKACLEVKHQKHYPHRVQWSHLSDDIVFTHWNRLSRHGQEVHRQAMMFEDEHCQFNSDAICVDCGTGRIRNETLWPEGVWVYWRRKWKVFCCQCRGLGPLSVSSNHKDRTYERYCARCWQDKEYREKERIRKDMKRMKELVRKRPLRDEPGGRMGRLKTETT